MSQRFTRVLLALFATSIFFTACKKQFSPDDPLPPVYTPNIIISSDNDFVYAFDPATGNKSWEFNVGNGNPNDKVISSPMLYNEMIYIATQNGNLYKLNANTGALVAKTSFLLGFTPGFNATPIADNGLLYLPSLNDTLYVVDTASFTTKWKYGTGGAIVSSPTIYQGEVIFGGTDGKVYSLNKTTGVVTWSFNAGTGSVFTSSPAVCGPYIYIGNYTDNNMYSIYAATGAVRWTFLTGGPIESSPSAYGGNCIFGSDDGNIYCVDTASGQYRWVDSTGQRIISSPFGYGNIVFAASYNYKLYAINILNGSYKWAYTTNALIKSSPIAYGANVYVGSFDDYLYALDTATGTLQWKENVNGQIECSPVIDDHSGASFNSTISGYTN